MKEETSNFDDEGDAESMTEMSETDHGGIRRKRSLEHQDVAPFPRNHVLQQRIHAHGLARDHVHEFARTEIAAQTVVGRGDVEQQRVAPFDGRRQRPEGLGRGVDEEKMNALRFSIAISLAALIASGSGCAAGKYSLTENEHLLLTQADAAVGIPATRVIFV